MMKFKMLTLFFLMIGISACGSDIPTDIEEIEDLIIDKEEKNLRIHDINEWRMYIWEGCSHKEEKITEREIDFYCKLLKGPCEFHPCPRNHIDYKEN